MLSCIRIIRRDSPLASPQDSLLANLVVNPRGNPRGNRPGNRQLSQLASRRAGLLFQRVNRHKIQQTQLGNPRDSPLLDLLGSLQGNLQAIPLPSPLRVLAGFPQLHHRVLLRVSLVNSLASHRGSQRVDPPDSRRVNPPHNLLVSQRDNLRGSPQGNLLGNLADSQRGNPLGNPADSLPANLRDSLHACLRAILVGSRRQAQPGSS